MKILFQLIIEEDNFDSFFDRNYPEVDSVYIANFLGYAKFWILDEYGNLICSFNNMLLDVVNELAAGYAGLINGKVTSGGVFVMEAENDGETHFWFDYKGGAFNFHFKAHDTVSLSEDELRDLLIELTAYAFKTVEFFYQGIGRNSNYQEWKSDVEQYFV